jgi:TolA-binding protein
MSEPGPQIEDIARVIRARIGGEATADQDAAGTARLAASIEHAGDQQRGFRLGAALVLAAACLALFSYVSFAKLTYVVSSSAPNAAPQRQSSVVFSDGSHIRLAPGGVGQVESTSFRGAVFRLDDGALDADVVHRPLTHWAVKAGPFTVEVKGTRFTVAWSRLERRFVLTLHEGSVEVRGAFLREAQTVRTGERLVVDLVAQRSSLQQVAAPATHHDIQSAARASGDPVTEQVPSVGTVPSPPTAPREQPQAPKPAPGPSWAERVATGDFQGVVADAQHRGADNVLTQVTSGELSALADAARYTGDRALSTKALNAQRQRFPGTERAAMAAFLLGKLAEESGSSATAADFYARYLSEKPSGTFAQEALGRRMLALRGADPSAAAAVAREYVNRFPAGPRAASARQIMGQP